MKQAVTGYKRAAKSLNELIEERSIGQIAKRYSQFKKEISAETLILLNIGELEDHYKKDGTTEKTKKSTTFVHELFEAGAAKEDIEYYFSKVSHAIRGDIKLTKNYMSLSNNPAGISITELLKQQSNSAKYQNIYSEIKRYKTYECYIYKQKRFFKSIIIIS